MSRDNWSPPRWHGSWAPEHPVQQYGGKWGSTLPLYLSIEDAAERVYSTYFGATPPFEEVERRLRAGEPLMGYRLLTEDPNAKP